MNAITNRKQRPASGIETALADDWAYFTQSPGCNYRIRKAHDAEIRRLVQAVERRLLELEEGCSAIALVHLTTEGVRRRVVVEACGFDDLDAMPADYAAKVFEAVTSSGWTAIEWGPT